MNLKTFLIIIITLVSWGVGSFIAKLAANRINTQSAFWDVLGYAIAIIVYSLAVFKFSNLIRGDKVGVTLAFLSGLVGSFGLIGFYWLMSHKGASITAPLTSLWPALTVILAILFLHESVNTTKLLGIILSLVAIYLLSR